MKVQFIMIIAMAAGAAIAKPDGRAERRPPTGADFVARLDKDDDQKISADEFDGPAEHFTQFDKDRDGYISEEEAPKGPPPRGEGEGEEPDEKPERDEDQNRKPRK
jgi:hypothetical protein